MIKYRNSESSSGLRIFSQSFRPSQNGLILRVSKTTAADAADADVDADAAAAADADADDDADFANTHDVDAAVQITTHIAAHSYPLNVLASCLM